MTWTKSRDTELQLTLVSWTKLLDRMDALTGDDGVKSDIRQLRGLAQLQDEQAFLPIHSEELEPQPRASCGLVQPTCRRCGRYPGEFRKGGYTSKVCV